MAEVREEKTPGLVDLAKAAMTSVVQNSQIQVSRFVIIPPRLLPKTSRYGSVFKSHALTYDAVVSSRGSKRAICSVGRSSKCFTSIPPPLPSRPVR